LSDRNILAYIKILNGVSKIKSNEKIVINILKTLVINNKKTSISLNSYLREDLGIDSMKIIYLALQLQQKMGITFNASNGDFDFTSINTVRDVIDLVDKLSKDKLLKL
jgi:Acyl carrier protein